MSFAENLQFLRKQKEITQEQLAESLEVSRQSVSKWESGQSFPEMEKLLQICNMFHCNMDTLIQGDVSKVFLEDTFGYDRQKNQFSRWVSAGIGLIMLGLCASLLLTGVGVSDELASVAFFVMLIVSVMIFVVTGMQMQRFTEKHPVIEDFYTEEEKDQAYKKFTVRVAAGVGIILIGLLIVLMGETVSAEIEAALSPVWVQEGDDFFGAVFMLLVAVGVTMLVYAGMQKEKYNIKGYNAEANPSPERKRRSTLIGKICGCIMLLATCIFLFWGLVANGWGISWVVYPIAGIFCGITALVLSGEGK